MFLRECGSYLSIIGKRKVFGLCAIYGSVYRFLWNCFFSTYISLYYVFKLLVSFESDKSSPFFFKCSMSGFIFRLIGVITIDWSVRSDLLFVCLLFMLYISLWREQLLIFFFILFILNYLSLTISEPIILDEPIVKFLRSISSQPVV